jgi:mRNA interferase RelE/StbE
VLTHGWSAYDLHAGQPCSPRSPRSPLRDKLSGYHSARLGTQWRVLYRIDESKHAVIVQDIQHRSTAYRQK